MRAEHDYDDQSSDNDFQDTDSGEYYCGADGNDEENTENDNSFEGSDDYSKSNDSFEILEEYND